MSEPFIGELKMFAGNFAPRNWSFCGGQLLAIAAERQTINPPLVTLEAPDFAAGVGVPERGLVAVAARRCQIASVWAIRHSLHFVAGALQRHQIAAAKIEPLPKGIGFPVNLGEAAAMPVLFAE